MPPTTRRRQIAEVARVLLDAEGPRALTMRRVADALGIRAPSLYKHVPDKGALEGLVAALGFEELGEEMEAAAEGVAGPAGPADEANPADRLAALGEAYRLFAVAHPDLYRLMNHLPLRRDLLPEDAEDRVVSLIAEAVGHDEDRARAVRGFAHGLASLEIDGRFPDGADLDKAWAVGLGSLMITAHEHTVQQ